MKRYCWKEPCNQAMVSKPWLVFRSTLISKINFLSSKLTRMTSMFSRHHQHKWNSLRKCIATVTTFFMTHITFLMGIISMFGTTTANFYHPLLQKQVVLATMQCKHKNEKFIGIFWEQLRETYKQIHITLLW